MFNGLLSKTDARVYFTKIVALWNELIHDDHTRTYILFMFMYHVSVAASQSV
jgi:hypothetical protein